MHIIHTPVINKLLKKIVFPFKDFIPDKYQFAIDGEVEIDLGKGKKMFISGNPTSSILRILFWKGKEGFEFDEYQIFSRLILKSNLFVDIGANLGFYAIAAKILNAKCSCIAFEPNPAAFKYLKQNIEINKLDIHISQLALSNKTGNDSFFIRRNKKFKTIKDAIPGDSSLNEMDGDESTWQKIEVKTEMFDKFYSEHFNFNQKIDFVKIDTEATEHIVFEGSRKILEVHRPIIMCEILRNKIEKELEEIFSKLNYSYFKIKDGKLIEEKSFKSDIEKENYFLIPKEKLSILDEII